MMKIMYESESALEMQNMEITQDQFNELVDASAISVTGYWLLSDYEWNILAIGLDQVPGGYDIELVTEPTLQ